MLGLISKWMLLHTALVEIRESLFSIGKAMLGRYGSKTTYTYNANGNLMTYLDQDG